MLLHYSVFVAAFLPFILARDVPPPPPGPPRPIIPKTYTAWLSVNYTTLDGSGIKFNGLELYAVDATKQRRVLNVTDSSQKHLHITQLYHYDTGKQYQIEWNEDVTLGKCTQMPSGKFDDIFEWVEQSSLAEYSEFLDWTAWAYSEEHTNVLLIVSNANPNVPMAVMFQNKTVAYTIVFMAFDTRTPPSDYYTAPSFCKNTTMYNQPRPSHSIVPPLPVMSTGSAGHYSDGGTRVMKNSVVREMVDTFKKNRMNI